MYTAATRDQHEAPASFSGDESPADSLARESDGDASPTNGEGTLKSWAKGTRSSRYGSVSGVPVANGSRSIKSLPRTQDLADALSAAARTEKEDEVRQDSWNFNLGCTTRMHLRNAAHGGKKSRRT